MKSEMMWQINCENVAENFASPTQDRATMLTPTDNTIHKES